MASARHLGSRFDHYLSREANSHQRHLRRIVFCVCVSAQLDYRRSMVRRGCADYGTDVPALRVLHDYGSEDDGEVEEVAVRGRVFRGVSRDVVASQPGCVRAALRAVSRWTNSNADRDLVGVTAQFGYFRQELSIRMFSRNGATAR